MLSESPRWLVVQGRLSKALDVLHSLREGGVSDSPDTSTARVERELMELWSAVEKERGTHFAGRSGSLHPPGILVRVCPSGTGYGHCRDGHT